MSLRTCVLAVAVAAALAACGQQPADTANTPAAPAEAKPVEKVLHIYNWSDYVAEDTIANFETRTGIKVVYDVYSENEVLEAKLMAGGSGYDLVFPSLRPFAQRHVSAGLYAPVDRARLSNYGNLDPALLAGMTDADPDNKHLVPYMWGTTGIGINVAKVREALGADAPLDSWSLLFDPANAEKLADCGISMLDDEQEAFSAVLIWKGRDPNQTDGDEIETVRSTFAAIRPHIRTFNNTQYINDLATGEVCLAVGYSGDIAQAAARAEEAETGLDIAYIIPKEGAVRWVDVMAIPTDAPHPDSAYAFINYVLEPEVIAGISNYVAYANPNPVSTALLDAEVSADPGIYPPAEVMAKLQDLKRLPDDAQQARIRAWTQIKSGR
ncbi:polyamine ABC transporter substrate-binding protein [Aquimonas sp.]|jgi:putrescine transport system substrate-binding protein|uniref:polyamine ABC transporter substrate-binding protein n=1 Tax=Aquimonas sp. TaxID=1872588 RepID=UPI0037C19D89